ncbi:hypothetical protein N499_0742A, partial [Wolbachia pipientis wVitA]
MGLSLRG